MADELLQNSKVNTVPYTSYYKDITKINNRERSMNWKILDYNFSEAEIVD